MRLILLFALISCASGEKSSEIGSVDLDQVDQNRVAINKVETSEEKTEEVADEQKETAPKINLVLHSSIYHSYAVLNLLKKLDKEEFKFDSVVTHGFASIVMALYAKDLSISTLEWKLFDFHKRLKGKKAFSKKWKTEVYEFISKEFRRVKFSDLKQSLAILVIEDGKVKLRRMGNVLAALQLAIDIKGKNNFLSRPQIIDIELKKLNWDINFKFAFMPEQVLLSELDGFAWGIYTRYLGFLMKEVKEGELIVVKGSKNIELDKLLPISDYSFQYRSSIDQYYLSIQNEMKEWKEENTSSMNN